MLLDSARLPDQGLRFALWLARPALLEALGPQLLAELREEARAELARILPSLPPRGPHRAYADQLLLGVALLLSLHRPLLRRGWTPEQTGALFYRATQTMLLRLPGPLRGLIGRSLYWKGQPEALHAGIVGKDTDLGPRFVADFLPGEGQGYTFGVDYHRCAIVELLGQLGNPELAPHICPLDFAQSEVLGWGLQRSGSIARGASRCDFRYTRGGPTQAWRPGS